MLALIICFSLSNLWIFDLLVKNAGWQLGMPRRLPTAALFSLDRATVPSLIRAICWEERLCMLS